MAGEFESPTALKLFNPGEPELSKLAKLHQIGVGFRRQFQRINTTYDDLDDMFGRKGDALDAEQDALVSESGRLTALIATNKVYATLSGHVRERGGSDEEAVALFEKLFEINCALHTHPAEAVKSFTTFVRSRQVSYGNLPKIIEGQQGRKMGIDGMFRNLVKNIPPYFDTDKKARADWPPFAAKFSIFPRIFQSDPNSYATYPDIAPEWLIEERQSGKAPTSEQVEEEQDRYLAEHRKLKEPFEAAKITKADLRETETRVLRGSHLAVEKRRRQLFELEPDSLEELLIFLEVQEETWVNRATEERILANPPNTLPRLSPEEYREQLIESFVGTHLDLGDQRWTMLFFEDSLKEAEINASDTINSDLQGTLGILLDVLGGYEDENEAQAVYQLLAQSHPHLYSAAEGLKPFFAIFPKVKFKDYQQVIAKGIEEGDRVASLLEIFSIAFQDRVYHTSGEVKRDLQQMTKGFAKKWLLENWEGAYRLLASVLPSIDEKKIEAEDTLITAQIKVIEAEIAKLAA